MSKPKDERYTVAVDFDGVIHEYSSPWVDAETIPDGPVAGAIEWLAETIQKLDVVIFSTRCKTWRGRRAVRAWLKQHAGMLWYPSPAASHGLEDIKLSYEKLSALVYIDDRALRFEGKFPSVTEIHQLKPWNKRGIGATGRFPEGRKNADDEGELQFRIGHDQDDVVIEFGKPVTWFGMPPATARQFAALILKHANEIRE